MKRMVRFHVLAGMILLTVLLLSFRVGNAAALFLPSGTEEVGEDAFRGCSTVHQVIIPDTVERIGSGAFQDCGEALLLRCGPDSAALRYAWENRLDYQAGTAYRALIIYQTYNGTERQLFGSEQDAGAIRDFLSRLTTTPYSVTVRHDLTADGISRAISSAFSGATERDVSLLYYSGHGNEDGSLVGMDRDFGALSPAKLKAAMDRVPGRKVIVVDACASGMLIQTETEENSLLTGSTLYPSGAAAGKSAFPAALISAFRSGEDLLTEGALNDSSYFVLTAAYGAEDSQEGRIRTGGKSVFMGYFTCALSLGCGWDPVRKAACAFFADANEDGAVSIQEAYAYASHKANEYNSRQSADVWPNACRWFAPFRAQEQ